MKSKVKSPASTRDEQKLKFKTIKYLFAFLIFNFSFLIFNLSVTNADDMRSSQYEMKYVNINMGSDVYNSETATLSATLGQLAAEEFSSSGYIVKAGFQYYQSIVPFTFSVSDSIIDFGEVTANVPVTSAADLTVSFGGAGQYQVTLAELGPMTKIGGADFIPDTGCDDGTCDETTSGPWILTATEGFGYNMSNEDIPATFSTCGITCFRKFPDSSALENPAVVMSSSNVTVDLASKPKDTIHQSTITYKLNVSPIQVAGTYQTIINYVATPSY